MVGEISKIFWGIKDGSVDVYKNKKNRWYSRCISWFIATLCSFILRFTIPMTLIWVIAFVINITAIELTELKLLIIKILDN